LINPLIAIPSPRTIPEVVQALGQVNKDYDLLWLKHMPEYMAYQTMQTLFINHRDKNYSHLVICPDDLLIEKDKLQILLDDYHTCLDPKERDITIMSGYCNVDHGAFKYFANISLDNVSPNRNGRTYNWLTLEDMRFRKQIFDNHPNTNNHKKKYLLKVKFAGFPLFVIPRKIVEQIPFRNDSPTGEFDSCGCCVDVMFCYDALQKGYQIYVDSRVGLDHLKISDQETSKSLKDLPLKQPNYYYEYAEEKKIMVN
jgi:hypothetical protein